MRDSLDRDQRYRFLLRQREEQMRSNRRSQRDDHTNCRRTVRIKLAGVQSKDLSNCLRVFYERVWRNLLCPYLFGCDEVVRNLRLNARPGDQIAYSETLL